MDFIELCEQKYLEFGYAKKVVFGVTEVSFDELFYPDTGLPILLMLLNSIAVKDNREPPFSHPQLFCTSVCAVFGVEVNEPCFTGVAQIEKKDVEYAIDLFGKLFCNGVDSLTWVWLLTLYIKEQLRANTATSSCASKEFEAYIIKLITSKYFFDINEH